MVCLIGQDTLPMYPAVSMYSKVVCEWVFLTVKYFETFSSSKPDVHNRALTRRSC